MLTIYRLFLRSLIHPSVEPTSPIDLYCYVLNMEAIGSSEKTGNCFTVHAITPQKTLFFVAYFMTGLSPMYLKLTCRYSFQLLRLDMLHQILTMLADTLRQYSLNITVLYYQRKLVSLAGNLLTRTH